MTITRRDFLKGAAIGGAALALPLKFGVRESLAFYQSPGLQKFIQPLHGVHAVPPEALSVALPDTTPAPITGVTHYTINIQQFQNQLHPNLGNTTLWGFVPTNAIHGTTGAPGAPNPVHLGGIIIAQRGVPIQITFRNQLTSNGLPNGIPLRNIIPVDSTLPGANTAQNRIAVHLHGGLVPWISDGGPFDWWAPNGTHGLSFLNNQVLNPTAASNEAEYYYGMNQSARLVWYHDHALGITRINAYAGVASALIIRDAYEAAMINYGLPAFIENNGNEIPIIVQDKIFVGTNISTADPTWVSKGLPSTAGSLWYPHLYEKNRWRLLGAGSRLPNPSVIAEMFGDTMLANGVVYPAQTVEARRYRLRILNACNARFLNFQLYVADPTAVDGITHDLTGTPGTNPNYGNPTNVKGPDWLVLGTEGGFLPAPVVVPSNIPFGFDPTTQEPTGSLLTGNAERFDVLVDFSGNAADGLPYAGRSVILYTDAPAPFPSGDPRNDYFPGSPGNPIQPAPGFGPNTRQIMRFDVVTATSADPALTLVQNGGWNPGINRNVAGLQVSGIDNFLATVNPDGTYDLNQGVAVARTRQITLNEEFDAYGRLIQMIGTNVSPNGNGRFARTYLSPATETPFNGDVEIWEVANLTGDTHPIHIHLTNAQILNRQAFDVLAYNGTPNFGTNPLIPPAPYETGWKETIRMNPGEVIRLIMKFDLPTITRSDGITPVDLRFAGGGQNGTLPPSPRTGGNEYVYHCHILEHEEHDMMRPLVVT